MRVVGSSQQISLPMAWNGAIIRLSRSFPDRDRIHDLSPSATFEPIPHTPTLHAAATKMGRELFLQDSTGLDEQTAVNRLVRHTHTFIIAELPFKPTGDLLRGPISPQLLRDKLGQQWVQGQV